MSPGSEQAFCFSHSRVCDGSNCSYTRRSCARTDQRVCHPSNCSTPHCGTAPEEDKKEGRCEYRWVVSTSIVDIRRIKAGPHVSRDLVSYHEMGVHLSRARFQLSFSGLSAAAIGIFRRPNHLRRSVGMSPTPSFHPSFGSSIGRWRESSKRVCLCRAPEVHVKHVEGDHAGVLTDTPASIGTAELCLLPRTI